jgi:precorrin-2 dehydrogenase/sirohydrochlorin ferrochelatase
MRLPLFIEMRHKNVLVIGGGSVGTSRVKKFLSAGANITVLSLDFSDELKELRAEGKIKLVKRDAFDREILEAFISKSDLVVVALNTQALNDRVIELSKKHNTLVNLTNDADETEVVVPFEARVGNLRIAMTSEGKSGIVVREALRKTVNYLSKDREIHDLFNLMYYLKKHMKEAGIPIDIRMKLYFEVFNDKEFKTLVSEGKCKAAKERLEKIVEAKTR